MTYSTRLFSAARGSAATALLVMLFAVSAHAQPRLQASFQRLDWPTVTLSVDVECADGSRVTVPDPAAWHVTDRGNPVQLVSVTCADTSVRLPVSVSLVLDASGSMGTSGGNAATKQGAHGFIDQMDGAIDEAAVLFFTQVVTVYQQMTSVKPMLHSAVDALPASGATALWDGIYAGIIELINNGVNPSRAVIAVADGQDNSSTRTVAEVIDLARRHSIAVHLIGIGSAIDATSMEQIAQLSGGRWYHAQQPSQVPGFFQQLYPVISNSRRCILEYDIIGPGCPDGLLHEVVVTVDPVCGGGMASDTVQYFAPLDSTKNTLVDIGFGDVTVKAANSYLLPLELRTPLARTVMPGISFHLDLGASCFDGSVGFPGDPSEFYFGKPAIVLPEGGGVRVTLPDTFTVDGSGVILYLGLRAPMGQADTTCCDALISDVTFDGPCYVAQAFDGRVCVVGRQPAVTCAMPPLPRISWKPQLNDYFPNPIPVTMEIANSGDAPADSLFFRIEYDRSAFTLATPMGEMVPGNPSTLDTGATQFVTWQLRPLPRDNGDTLRICITATFNNHADVRCCVDLYIPPRAKPALDVACGERDTIAYDPSSPTAWSPELSLLRAEIRNTGVNAATGVVAELLLPPGMVLDAGETVRKTVGSGTLQPWSPGDPVPAVEWRCRWMAPRCTDTLVTVFVQVSGQEENGTPIDPVSCVNELFIQAPVAPWPIRISPPGPIDICEGDSVELDAGAGFTSYNWSVRDHERYITVRQSGSYTCIVGYGFDCPAFTDTVIVAVHPPPAKPVITRTLDILEAPAASTWLWERDGMLLQGDTLQTLQLPGTGSYRVRVTNAAGCEAWSDPFDVTVLGVHGEPLSAAGEFIESFHSWPNPASGTLMVGLRLHRAAATVLSLHDLLGREVRRVRLVPSGRDVTERMDVSGLRPGLYLLRLHAEGETRSRMVILR